VSTNHLEIARGQLSRALPQVAAELDNQGDPPATVRTCAHVCHLITATRWAVNCTTCGKPLLTRRPETYSTLTGYYTYLYGHDAFQCFDGTNTREEVCGHENPPTERILALDSEQVEAEVASWARITGTPEGELTDDAAEQLAHSVISRELNALRRQCNEARRAVYQQLRHRLLHRLNLSYLWTIENGLSPDEAAQFVHGVEDENSDLWMWDYAADGNPVVASLNEIELVALPEVARIAGLTIDEAEGRMNAGNLPSPEPIAGSSTIVWRRDAIEAWADARSAGGRE
jgi:predicted DNA-binding transcriptional regulator AlpA